MTYAGQLAAGNLQLAFTSSRHSADAAMIDLIGTAGEAARGNFLWPPDITERHRPAGAGAPVVVDPAAPVPGGSRCNRGGPRLQPSPGKAAYSALVLTRNWQVFRQIGLAGHAR